MGKLSSALEWFGIETRSAISSSNPDAPAIPVREDKPRAVSVSQALATHDVFRAVQILCTSASQLTLDAYRGGEVDPATPTLLVAPDASLDLDEFLSVTVASLAVSGNFFWLVTRDAFGQVMNLEVLPPAAVQVKGDAKGRPVGYAWNGRDDYTPADIIHRRLFIVPGQARGVGPIQQAQIELRGAVDVREYAGHWFQDAALPAGGNYLQTAQNLAPTAAKELRDGWLKANRDREGIPILFGGVDLKSFLLTPSEAKWLEAQNFDIVTTTRMFGVPASLMLAAVDGKSQSYQNVSQEWLGFVRFTLMAYLRPIEKALSRLLPVGVSARFNIEGLLRADAATRYAAHKSGIEAGWLLPSEVRAIEGLPAVAGIDDRPRPVAAPEPLHVGELNATPVGEVTS